MDKLKIDEIILFMKRLSWDKIIPVIVAAIAATIILYYIYG